LLSVSDAGYPDIIGARQNRP